jgi:hypothetical protein
VSLDFSEQVAADASEITAEDVDGLRRLGLSDVEALDVALAAAARCFFAKVLNGMRALPDSQFRDLLEPPPGTVFAHGIRLFFDRFPPE